jgi:hypothetical protein
MNRNALLYCLYMISNILIRAFSDRGRMAPRRRFSSLGRAFSTLSAMCSGCFPSAVPGRAEAFADGELQFDELRKQRIERIPGAHAGPDSVTGSDRRPGPDRRLCFSGAGLSVLAVRTRCSHQSRPFWVGPRAAAWPGQVRGVAAGPPTVSEFWKYMTYEHCTGFSF